MSTGRAILLITLVIPGLLMAFSSIYSYNVDYEAMGRTEKYVEKLVRDGRNNDKQLQLAYHRSLIHRMNALSDGTWGFIGATIAAIGIHGIATTNEEIIRDERKKAS